MIEVSDLEVHDRLFLVFAECAVATAFQIAVQVLVATLKVFFGAGHLHHLDRVHRDSEPIDIFFLIVDFQVSMGQTKLQKDFSVIESLGRQGFRTTFFKEEFEVQLPLGAVLVDRIVEDLFGVLRVHRWQGHDALFATHRLKVEHSEHQAYLFQVFAGSVPEFISGSGFHGVLLVEFPVTDKGFFPEFRRDNSFDLSCVCHELIVHLFTHLVTGHDQIGGHIESLPAGWAVSFKSLLGLLDVEFNA